MGGLWAPGVSGSEAALPFLPLQGPGGPGLPQLPCLGALGAFHPLSGSVPSATAEDTLAPRTGALQITGKDARHPRCGLKAEAGPRCNGGCTQSRAL